MYVKNTLARSNAYYGAWALNAGASDLAVAAATTRVAAIQASLFAAEENIQTHGGMGFTWEFDCQFYYRRAKLLSLAVGSEKQWQSRLSRWAGRYGLKNKTRREEERLIMDFNDTPEQAAFRAAAADWLAANVPSKDEIKGMNRLEVAKLWQKRKYDAGWACIGWDPAYGGRGASAIEQVIWKQEEAKYDVPAGFFVIGQGHDGTNAHGRTRNHSTSSATFLSLRAAKRFGASYSRSPRVGPDLAALRTKAEKDGDEWVINGQKIWTSGAHYSDFGCVVVRTDPSVPKHKGLSYFFIDMKSPGIEVKPIKQLTGESDFNEVYFTDVRVPDSQRLGEVGQGWQVSLTTLMNERAAIGAGSSGVNVKLAIQLAKEVMIDGKPAIEDSAVKARLASFYVEEAGLKYTSYRTLSALSRGDIPGPENSIGKLVGAPKMQQLASFCMDLLETSGAIWDTSRSKLADNIIGSYMGAPGLRIAGGTDEIMTNIIAERVLGLPQEPRMDKGIPFTDVPTG
jgi:alkylation response protein AidB-like acyl-CoA dehydrogenase